MPPTPMNSTTTGKSRRWSATTPTATGCCRHYPDVYLFGLMVEVVALGRNVEMAQLYKARRDEVFAEIIQLYALTTGATSPGVRTAEYY